MLNNIPQVTKNLLILNIMFFVATIFLGTQGIDLKSSFGIHAPNSILFEPYQIITHFFMHGDFMHLFFNMFGIVIFGSHLERVWGAKRFFIFYVIAAIGAVIFTGVINFYELSQIQAQLDYNEISLLNKYIQSGEFNIHTYGLETGSDWREVFENNFNNLRDAGKIPLEANINDYASYSIMNVKWSVGASGALLGLLAGFVILFPNTELMLLFIPIPIKAKYLIGAYLIYQFMMWYQGTADGIDYGAHVGGAITGGIMVLYWRRQDRSNFW
jgi:membrane associated rhomboid family serine protease